MKIINPQIDGGKAFDFGRTSSNYAKYRDIYPKAFYEKIIERGLCVKNQRILDLGTGTGVLPRNLYSYGAEWVGADISEKQIGQARQLAKANEMNIDFLVSSAEDLDFPDGSFDVITACQCFWYFDHKKIAPKLAKMLKPGGRLLLLQMEWLPFEDEVAGASEALVLKYNPEWSGAGEIRHAIPIPDSVSEYFDLVFHEEYDLMVPFTRESWNGRMKTCRGIGASLSEDQIRAWEQEHLALLEKIAPPEFEVLHDAALAELRKR